MPYIGSAVSKSTDIKRITFATTTTGSGPFALGWTPASENTLRVTVNGVVQQDSSMTLSGANLTLVGVTLVSGDELEVQGIVNVGAMDGIPMDGSVTEGKIGGNAVTAAKIASDAVTSAKIGSGAVTAAKLDTSGTASASTYLSGTMAWTAVAGTSVATTKTTGTTTLDSDDASGYVVVPCDSSGGNVIIKLPAAASAWSGSVLHIVASAAPGSGYNVAIQNSGGTELAQLNKKGDYYTVTCDSGGSNLVVIDHNQSYGGWLITTNQQAGMAHSLGAGQLFTDPTKYSVGYNYGSWWDSLTDKLTVPTGWAGRIYLNLNSGNRSAGYVATGIDKDGSQLKTPVIYLAAGAPQPFEWDEAVTGGEEYVPYGFNTYTSSTRYIEDGCVFTWTAVRDI